jgi:quercetin dioxygenase-like cupin family protein
MPDANVGLTMSANLRFPDVMRVPASQMPAAFSPEPGLLRRILAHNENMMLVEHYMEEGWVGTRHSHPNDQLVYVVSGQLRFQCGDATFEGGAGESFILRGGVEHQAWALQPSVVLDVFTPYRKDYLP